MQNELRKTARNISASLSRKRKWLNAAIVLCSIVAVWTTYVFISPAATKQADVYCGFEEHKEHDDSCYEKVLICGLEEMEGHVHSDECYKEESTLTCELKETEGHVHSDECYVDENIVACGLVETDGHVHSEECYIEEEVVTCGLEETDGHVHSDECYVEENVVTCGLEETDGHVHSEECYIEENILTCTNTEEDHVHTEECYETVQTLSCSLEECEPHHHDDTCYTTEKVLNCGLEECEPHHHDDTCYTTEEVLNCGLEECEPHHHDDTCYTTEKVLNCGLEECEPHHHDDTCYTIEKVLSCGLPEQEPHKHTEECYQINHDHLICGKQIHEHTLQCFSNPAADVESASKWEEDFKDVKLTGNWDQDLISIAETQIGYTESTANYQVQADGTTMKGYTRYGAWYGSPYGDWCAMFISFCLDYAKVDADIVPHDAACDDWVATLREDPYNLYHPSRNEIPLKEDPNPETRYTPLPGDLMFIDRDEYDPEHPEDRLADHVGIVVEVIEADEKHGTQVRTIEGNANNQVMYVTYDITDDTIIGYGELPENPYTTIESAPASDGAVAVIKGILPMGAEAVIEAVTLTEEEMIAFFGAEKAAAMDAYIAYDIKIMVDGEEWQPDETVSVTVRQSELSPTAEEVLAGAHVDSETEEVSDVKVEIDDEGEISFDADGFSLYIFYTFTVDFHYGDLSFSINGMDSILLSELFEALDIEENAADVADLRFSEETLVAVSKNENDEWVLTSLAAFDTNETLTITFNDGRVLEIAVTDAVSNVQTTVTWNANTSTVTIRATGSKGNNESVSMVYTYNTNSTSTLASYSTKGQSFTMTGTLSASTVSSDETFSSIKVGGTTVANSLPALLDKVSKPSSQTDSFSTWLSSYDRAKSTLSDVLTAFGKYQNGEAPTSGGGDDPSDYPYNVTAEWSPSSASKTGHLDVTVSGIASYTGKVNLWSVSTNGTSSSSGSAIDVVEGQPFELTRVVYGPYNGDYTKFILRYSPTGYSNDVREEIEQLTTSDGTSAYILFDMVPCDPSPYGYESDVFSEWLETDYEGNPAYGSPTLPLTGSQPWTAFYYFYSGNTINGPIVPIDFDPEGDVVPAPEEVPLLDYHGFNYEDTVEITKKIDWLGEDAGGNTVAGMEDFYRLYLGFDATMEPVDLLLVVDQSTSMEFNQKGKRPTGDELSRQQMLNKFLDGENADHSDGFIYKFLNVNENNNIAIVTFGSDSSLYDERYIHPWDSTAVYAGLGDEVFDPSGGGQATNYAAAYWAANEVWKDCPESGNQKVMIFLSDGEPTLGYLDGQMHHGYADPENIIGQGSSTATGYDIRTQFSDYLSMAYDDAIEVQNGEDYTFNDWRSAYYQEPDWGSHVDEDDNYYNEARWVYSATEEPYYPYFADMLTMEIEVPGLVYPLGGFVNEDGSPDADASTFLTWYNSLTSQQKERWVLGDGVSAESHVTNMPRYDLFALTEQAYADFCDENGDVTTFAIGYAMGINSQGEEEEVTYPNGYSQSDVLRYMAGDNFFLCKNDAELTELILSIVQMKNLVMTDKLSAYVQPAADPDLVITMTLNDGVPITLYDDLNGTGFTLAGEEYLNTSATKLGPTELKVVFDSNYYFIDSVDLQAEFTIKVKDTAVNDYVLNGYNYGGTKGDIGPEPDCLPITDYDTEHVTSSGMDGFYSNDSSSAMTWYQGGPQTMKFPMPVVQLSDPPVETPEPEDPDKPAVIAHPVIHKTIDYLGDNDGEIDNDNPDTAVDANLEGLDDVYRLYLDLKDETDPVNLLLVIDRSNSMYDNKDMLIDPNGGDGEDNKQTRMEAMLDFLNGTAESSYSDGFIHQFLAANPDNQIAAVSFGTDAGTTSGNNNDYLIDWTKSYSGALSVPQYEGTETSENGRGGTNYAAGYYIAADKLGDLEAAADSKTYVLFISDGVPTTAYTDGMMHQGLTPTGGVHVFGTGSDSGFLPTAAAARNIVAYTNWNTSILPYIFDTNNVIDYQGNDVSIWRPISYLTYNQYHTGYPRYTGGYPVGYDPHEITIDYSKLGLSYNATANETTIIDSALFNTFKDKTASIMNNEEFYNAFQTVAQDVFQSTHGTYDLFDLSMSAYDDFLDTVGDDVNVVAIGFSGELSKKYYDMNGEARYAKEVLNYMGANGGEYGGYLYCPSAQNLAEEVNKLFLVQNALITDELSAAVEIYDETDLVVYRRIGSGTPEYLYQKDPVTGVYDRTTLGKTILDSVTINNGVLTVDFKDDYALDNRYTYSVSFNVEVTETTKAAYVGVYPDVGDDETNYGTNNTSSLAPGFYSNASATLVWGENRANPVGTLNYQKPVVQVKKQPVIPEPPGDPTVPDDPAAPGTAGKQIDYLGDNVDDEGAPLTGMDDLYRLYLSFESQPEPVDLLLVIDQSSSMGFDLEGDKPYVFDPVLNESFENELFNEERCRQTILVDFLKGTEADHSDGFIKKFLDINELNSISIVTFSTDAAVLTDWVSSTGTDDVIADIETMMPSGTTNYTASLAVANEQWEEKASSTNRKIMIFLSDGAPVKTNIDGSIANEVYTVVPGAYDQSLSDFTANYLNLIYKDAKAVKADPTLGSNYKTNREEAAQNPSYYPVSYNPSYPNIYERSRAVFKNVPGVNSGYFGTFTDADASDFLNFYENDWNNYSLEEKEDWAEQHLVTLGDYIDIFYLSEESFYEFSQVNPNVITYTIGFADDFSGETTEGRFDHGRRYSDEVLKYMAGELREDAADRDQRYFFCGSASDLADTINALFEVSDVVLTDELSEDVLFAEQTDFEIILTDEKFSNKTIYPDYPYLYKDGDFTDLGELLLDTDATGFDDEEESATYGTIKVTFDSDIVFSEDMKVEVAFTVEVNPDAISKYEDLGNGYGGVRGELGTDYENPDTTKPVNNTSSGQPGFWSNNNENAMVTWVTGADTEHLAYFPKPVIQVEREPIVPVKPEDVTPIAYEDEVTVTKQVDYMGDNRDENGNLLQGMNDLYRLYIGLEAKEQPVDLLLVIDQSNSMNYDTEGDPPTIRGSANPAFSGTTRQQYLVDFLNGTESDNSDGFIKKFLDSNEDNDLSIVVFSGGLSTYTKVLSDWGTDADSIIDDIDNMVPFGATNYTAALSLADQQWGDKTDSENRKVMIFLSDGVPTETNVDGSIDGTKPYSIRPGDYTSDHLEEIFGWYFLGGIELDAYAVNEDPSLGRDYTVYREDYLPGHDFEDMAVRPFEPIPEIGLLHSYPVLYDWTDMDVEVPGLTGGFMSAFTDDYAQDFIDFNDDYQNDGGIFETDPEAAKLQWLKDHVNSMGDSYDIFYLSEWSYHYFEENNPDVTTYAIGFGGDFDDDSSVGQFDNGNRYADEVLKYMVGEENIATSQCKRYFQCDDDEGLTNVFDSLFMLKDIVLTDTLSSDVEFAPADKIGLEIKLTDETHNDLTKYPDYPYLYQNGDFTDLGRLLLDTTATKIYTVNGEKKVDVVFLPTALFNEDLRVEASFNVRVKDTSIERWENNGKNYDTGVLGDIGPAPGNEKITDYDKDHITSSGLPGFWSNDNEKAMATWKRNGPGEANFPRPVVQVPPNLSISLLKVDADETTSSLAGAEFDLYREVDGTTAGCTTYEDASGTTHYLQKINTSPIVSVKDTPVEIEDLFFGHFYLFETKAPSGYMGLPEPIEFELNSNGTATVSDANVITSSTEPLKLTIKNVSGYEIPEFGGSGTTWFTLCGTALMSAAVMYGFSVRRKRERRRT